MVFVSLGAVAGPWAVYPAIAAPAVDLDEETRALVEQMTTERAALLVRERRLADEREAEQLERFAKKEKELRAVLKSKTATEAELKKARNARARLARKARARVDRLARRDRQFEAEIAAYREAVTGLAQTPNPEKRAALEWYASGDRVGGYAVLEDITRAENAARAKATVIANAANLRELVPLALDMKDRGEKTTTDVIGLCEEVTRLDPGVFWDWIELADLYREAGRLVDVERAVLASYKIAKDERDKAVSLFWLGTVAVERGKLKEATAHYEAVLVVMRRLAKANPTSADAQRDLSISFNKLGDVAVQAGDLKLAKARFEDSLQIRKRLAKANPTSADAQRGLSISFNRLGVVTMKAGDVDDARNWFEQDLAIAEKLAKDNPLSAEAQRDVIATCIRLGQLTNKHRYWERIRDILRTLKSDGRISDAERSLLADLEEALAS